MYVSYVTLGYTTGGLKLAKYVPKAQHTTHPSMTVQALSSQK
jgi:hypothetical protein